MEGVMADKKKLRGVLRGDYLKLHISNDHTGIFADTDSFVALSQGNTSIKQALLYPYDSDPGNYELWEKVGQGVGNLKSLSVLRIILNESLAEPDWEVLARILPHIQSKIELRIMAGVIAGLGEMRAFSRAIQGHPAITQFSTITTGFSFENVAVATLCSALTTLVHTPEPRICCSRALKAGQRRRSTNFHGPR
jgi:hypothetical protein